MKKTTNNKMEFSKRLLLQESMLIWIITIAFIILAFVCVTNQYFGELPWLAAMCGFPWTAYGASQAFYFRKAEKENTEGGIKYETIMHEYRTNDTDPLTPLEDIVEDAKG
jgi:EamA domain-containing membrane protein RarD